MKRNASPSTVAKRVRPVMGTFVEIELQAAVDDSTLQGWITDGFNAVADVDHLMSAHRPDSDLTRLNKAKPWEWVEVHDLTRRVLKASNDLFSKSLGAFDIRCGASLVKRGLLPAVPGDLPISSPNEKPPLEIHGRRVRKTGRWMMDLGGIAKGFAVDYAIERIRRGAIGVAVSGIVNAGGDLRTWGRRAPSVGLRILGPASDSLRRIKMGPLAAATSSVRSSDSLAELTTAAAVRMPHEQVMTVAGTITVFARCCVWADALTKVVMTQSAAVAEECLSAYQARALVFHPSGKLSLALGSAGQ